jgi:4-hydroxybenzoate polyprenyltransferase
MTIEIPPVKRLTEILKDIKIQHTVFALPFAIMSAFIAADGWPGLSLVLLIIVGMVFARSAAMAFNRLVDLKYDKDNPRTKERALAAGRAFRIDYAIFVIVNSAGFIFVCWMINQLAFQLSFVALAIVFFYSYTKRFTASSHFFLGLALALAPIGAWVAVREEISLISITLGAAVVFWLAGLDTIYSCQDAEFDTKRKLHSVPGRFGIGRALKMSAGFHAVMALLLIILGFMANLSWLYLFGVIFTAAMLYYEHSIVKPDDLSRVNISFFNANGIISVGLMLFTIADVILL